MPRTMAVSPLTLRGVEDGHGQGIHDWTRIVHRGDRNASAHASMVCRGKHRREEMRPSLHARIVTPDRALPPRAFGLALRVLLTTEATGGTITVLTAEHEPRE